MNDKRNKREKRNGAPLLLSILLVFCLLGAMVYMVSRKISKEMSVSAIQNVSESLDLIQCTIEAILRSETEFQTLIAQEVGRAENPEDYVLSFDRNQMMAKLSLILSGKTEGVSNTGEPFTEEGLDFSAGGTVMGFPVSQTYLNYMGTWSYTIQCPIERDGQTIGTLYAEYVYDAIDQSLPDGFYNKQALLYIMDAESERFVLKPKGMGQRSAGHLNLSDFYRANDIQDPEIRAEVDACLESGWNLLFYHNIRDVQALNYMWPVNGGTIFLVGYVPLEAIQQEGRSVNQHIMIVVASLLAAFSLCILLYYRNWRQQERQRAEREAERKIYSQQLAEALRAAQIASESKTVFLSNMSHDIRTPMNAVLGFTTLLSNEAENPIKVREYTKKIMASGHHLLSLINDILDVSKIESGKVVLNYEPFALNDVISSIDTIIQPMTRAKEQEFHLEVTGIRHEYLVGDETRINQILINLLSNAVKYTPEGGKIWCRILGLKQRSSQFEHICIEVEDNGYGMTQEYLQVIFDAFTRAENSTTNKVQGTGLGMAITKNIVELMGGTIEVASEVDKGTIFTVDLELRISEQEEDSRFWKNHGISQILVVDDDPDVRESIQALMEDTGVLTDTLQDGEAAVEALQNADCGEKSYQMVLLDWKMPGIDGVETARRIRREIAEDIPILLLTAYDWDEIEEEAREAGIDGFLTKPFFVSALKEKILELTVREEEHIWNTGEESGLEGEHFLVAEDNEINAEILEELLSIEGADCEILENGELVVERFANAQPGEFDAILMDVQMPVMNGYEATRRIRALEREDAASIPIVAMTANAFAEDVKEALNAGMNAHVSKPVDMEVLKRTIKELKRRG